MLTSALTWTRWTPDRMRSRGSGNDVRPDRLSRVVGNLERSQGMSVRRPRRWIAGIMQGR
jgi:hypothetical protein